MNVINEESHVNPLKSNTSCEDKITLLECPLGCMKCKRKVSEINQYYCESDKFQYNNEYQLSIETLKGAFNKTLDLQEPTCIGCSQLLRHVIIDSLQNVYNDLKKLSSGFLTRKSYKISFLIAKNTLKELRAHIGVNQEITY